MQYFEVPNELRVMHRIFNQIQTDLSSFSKPRGYENDLFVFIIV